MTSLRFSRKIALRYLWSKRAEAFITIITVVSVLGVAIGVMVLNITMAIMTGFQSELKNRIVGANSHILVRSIEGRIEDWRKISQLIEKVDGLSSISPFTQNQALVRVEGGSASRAVGVYVRGIEKGTSTAAQLAQYMHVDPNDLPLFDPPSIEVADANGRSSEVKLPGLIVGRELQRTLGVLVGSPVSILSPQMSATPFGLVPKFRRFVVVGFYSSGLIDFDNGLAFANLPDAQRFFDFGNSVSGLEIRVNEIDQAPQIADAIMNQITHAARGLYVQPWTETNRPLWEALKFERRVYFIVLLLIIVMASFSIVTTLIMLVLEKRKDIAILRTMGASSNGVWRIFYIQGATIGALGTALGLILGLLGCWGLQWYGFPIDERIFQMSTVPVKIEPLNFVVVGLAAFLICCVATLYPSLRASRLNPAETLRYE